MEGIDTNAAPVIGGTQDTIGPVEAMEVDYGSHAGGGEEVNMTSMTPADIVDDDGEFQCPRRLITSTSLTYTTRIHDGCTGGPTEPDGRQVRGRSGGRRKTYNTRGKFPWCTRRTEARSRR